jgi:uncharacterized protein (TIGR02996 family)
MALPDEQAALLRAIVSHAEEDTPRLVYADWLQENGDAEQAAFIRDSIRLARGELRAEEAEPLGQRLKELAYERGDAWVQALGIACTPGRFERGLPLRVTFDGASEFLSVADVLFALLPIRALQISAFGDSDELDDDAVIRLAEMPELARLTDLRLIDHPLVNAGAWEAFFDSQNLPRLEYLSIGGCGVGTAEAEALAGASALDGLTALDLSHNSIGNDGARALVESRYLRKKLQRLWLEDNFFISDELREWLRAWLGEGLFLHSSPHADEEIM